ncbi:sodium-dependent transporter bedraggled isoform X1 [Rhopalosiphum padi]|uniref:sodium-dependent transporter bedraggled isoform X1 n=1 Tax=Rhopalosiphum padi TaxID=40932 RepID=UPI00298E33AA|nr:sodium-dependent transporter bedraggled isoform X1 [Rhopalosiphum padi]
MRGLSSTIDDTGGGCGSDVDHLQGNEAEDHFEPSLFNEYPPLPLSEDVHTAFLATNLLLLYLNLARLSTMSIGDAHQLPVTVNDRDDRYDDDNNGLPESAAAVSVTTAVQATAERRLSNEWLPGEPGPSTDDRRPWPADATTSVARVPQRHHRHYRSDSCRPPPPTTEPYHRQTGTTTTASAMITVAASGSRAMSRPKPRTRGPSSSIPFPVDVVDRLRSPMASPSRPRQYGRRRSVQDAVATAMMLQRHEGLQLQTTIAVADDTTAEPDAEQLQVPGAVREPGQEPRLVASIRAYEMSQESQSPLGQWSNKYSSVLATLGCTLGAFNISRFAILAVQFGANFILQFLVLSLLVGIPLFTFHSSLGQLLGAGVMDMWRISPIFKGIGIALLLAQAFIGTYTVIGISWMFTYFRDSFITKQDVYRWAEPIDEYKEDGMPWTLSSNVSYNIEETVPGYFNGIVLQRKYVEKLEMNENSLKLPIVINLTIIWTIVFICLSKGLKSYSKVMCIFSLVPVFGMFMLCTKMLGLAPMIGFQHHDIFPETDWSEFFLNTKSWVAAFTETFLTWGILGACTMQITSHNRPKHLLHRDASLVIILTIAVLVLAAFLANTCVHLLEAHGYMYLPSSFERMSSYTFLFKQNSAQARKHLTPVRWMQHSSLFMGERTMKNNVPGMPQESGYQAMRLATELFPATFAMIGAKNISPFWSVLFYFVLIMFGIGQQIAIWHCVVSGIISLHPFKLRKWRTTITFLTCAAAFSIGLFMATELGIFIVYLMDYCVGCGWWIMILYLLEIGALFMVRGRPYSGETVVATLFSQANHHLQVWMAPMLSFDWNIVVPVALILLSTSVFKNGGYRWLYNWKGVSQSTYWSTSSREFGCLLQIVPLLIVPFAGIVQTCRYLATGPPDLFDRIQMLYRPVIETRRPPETGEATSEAGVNGSAAVQIEDPPPKYTPPPSYSTATGARIAKMLRQSIRRSVRRLAHVLGNHHQSAILGESSSSSSAAARTVQAAAATTSSSSHHQQTTILSATSPSTDVQQTISAASAPPPDYTTVLVEMNRDDDDVISVARTVCGESSSASSLSDEQSTSIECLMERAAPINVDRTGPVAAAAVTAATTASH